MINVMTYSLMFTTASLVLVTMQGGKAAHQQRISAQALRKDIKKNLPLGSTASEVIEFLDARGIRHSKLEVVKFLSDYPNEEDLMLIRAAIPKVKQGLLIEWGIYMSFRFDEEERLVDWRVNKVGTGP